MNEYDIINEITKSAKYSGICPETVARVASESILRHKTGKLAVKAAKTVLHRISGAFISRESLGIAERLVDSLNENTERGEMLDVCGQVLRLHASTLERLSFFEEMSYDILRITGGAARILDSACGLNPFTLPFLNTKPGFYAATDINTRLVGLVSRFFDKAGINGVCLASDAISGVFSDEVDLALVYKLLPVLEQQKKGYGAEYVRRINCGYAAVTFPTRTLTGKRIGMFDSYTGYIERHFDKNEICFTKEYRNELLFIIKKRK